MARQKASSPTTNYLLPVLVICSGMIISFLLFTLLLNVNTRRQEQDFNYRASQIGIRIDDTLERAIGMLEGTSNLFYSDSPISQPAFHHIAGRLLESQAYKGVYWFSAIDLQRPRLRVERAATSPILPSEIMERATRRAADSRKPITLPEIAYKDGELSDLPIAIPVLTESGTLKGVLLGVLDMHTLWQGFFMGDIGQRMLGHLFPLDATSQTEGRDEYSFYFQQRISLYDTDWLLAIRPGSLKEESLANSLPWIMLGVGLLLACLVGILLFHLMGRNAQIARQVAERTHDLQRAGEALEIRSRDLALAKENAEKASHAKSDFLANMSHEIRTPLNSMIGLTELVLSSDLSSYQRNHLKTVLASADNLLEIINDILDFSKIEAGKLSLENTPFDLLSLCERTLALFSARAAEKPDGLELVLDYSPNLPRYVTGDATRLRQVIQNLLSNALKFTNKGHVALKLEPVLGETQRGGGILVRLSVKDTGIGIPQEKIQIIFDKFSQADTSTTRRFGGTGLGLSICRQIVGLMQGEMGVESLPGSGSTFWCIVQLAPDLSVAPQLSLYGAFPFLTGKEVLLACRDTTLRLSLESLLATHQMQVFCAMSVDSAEAMLQQRSSAHRPFDFALVDDRLQDSPGHELTREWSMRHLPATRLILLGDADAAREGRCDGYIEKPIFGAPLLELLSTLAQDVHLAGDAAISAQDLLPEATTPALEEQATGFNGARVLLVEDSAFNRAFALEVLTKMDCRTDYAVNGIEALEKVQSQNYDIVLMDCQMPEMDGYEASAQIRHLKSLGKLPDMPVIALTAHALAEDRQRCLDAGMQDYLTKPIRVQALRELLARWLPSSLSGVQAA